MPFFKRKHSRIPLNVFIKVRMQGKEIEGAELSNISLGGMCILFNSSFEEGPTGKVWLSRKYGTEELFFEGDFRKVWVKKVYLDKEVWRMGVVFREMVPEQRDNLYRIVKREASFLSGT